ncbi:hypothetical protein C804_00918 [Lachnospiraceae bacterium A4]|nr:hypothetical protein C804_00918 [Lachnospiraceae bacterium A4]
MNWWESSTLWGIIGLIGGFLISSFYYFLGKTRKSLIFYIETSTLISNNVIKLEGLDIKFDNKPITYLYCSTIRFKNSGNTIIKPTDFETSNPLSIIINRESIDYDIQVQILKENNINNTYYLINAIEDNICYKAIIDFEYIPKKETLSFIIFHTESISIVGKMQDGKLKNNESLKWIIYVIYLIVFLCMGIAAFIFGVLSKHI